ncbi:hypothetical protein Sjap_012112 [Stephania japonica]|uniref:Kinesin motor domain-containing protein n=1 Tax=Stephania japonica TaxID=461633 RepID=A0AAP0IW41_9MAGN
MESRKSLRNLADSIRSLLGLKTHLTSTWADSVCNIIKDLPSEEPFNDYHLRNLNLKTDSFENKDNDDLGTDVLKIQDDLAALYADLNTLNSCRRQALNDYLDLKGNIRVFCRIRPITEGEKFGSLRPVVAADSCNVVLRLSESKTKHYCFDKVFHPHSSQVEPDYVVLVTEKLTAEVFSEVEPVIKSAVDGYNACIFAYGQTGTGKTFTMEGQPDCPGIVPLAIEALFKQAADSCHSFHFTFSMLEIYMGNLRDLLIPQTAKSTDSVAQCLSVQKDPRGGIEIDNLVTIRVSDFNQAKRLYGLGSRFRSTASTNSNETSSRSHCLTRISMTCFDAPERRRETNKLWMVDLGGSERVLKTKAWGKRLDEGKAINLSLSALGDVINALQRRKSHVPYRNSKLTQVLTDSLGEDSKTLMVVHISPKEEDLCETVCSLGFAARVRSVHLGNVESIEGRAKKEVAMAQLLQRVQQLEYESQDVRNDIKKLKERLHQLTRTEPSPHERVEDQYLSERLPQCKESEERFNIDTAGSFPAKLPRFMRPTICSKKKSGLDQPVEKWMRKRDSNHKMRKRSSSVRAESVTFPLKGISDCGSECGISRTSCLTDYETEYSNNASECEIKMVALPEQKKHQRILAPLKPPFSHESSKKYENGETNKVESSKGLLVNNWLHRLKTEPANALTNGSRRIPAIPLPQKKDRSFEHSTVCKLNFNEMSNIMYSRQEFNNEQLEKLTILEKIRSSVEDLAIDRMQYSSDDTVKKKLGSASVSSCRVEEAINLQEGLDTNSSCCTTIDDAYSGVIHRKDIVMETEWSGQRSSDDSADIMLNVFTTNGLEFCDHTSSTNENICSINQNEKSELEAEYENLPLEVSNEIVAKRISVIEQKDQVEAPTLDEHITAREKGKEDFCDSQNLEVLATACLLDMKSRRALFMNVKAVDEKNYIEISEEQKCPTGMLDLIRSKVQTICASTLLGLGVQNLGLGHDFFDGLML